MNSPDYPLSLERYVVGDAAMKSIVSKAQISSNSDFRGRAVSFGLSVASVFQKVTSFVLSLLTRSPMIANQIKEADTITTGYYQNLNLQLMNIQQKLDEDIDPDLLKLTKKWNLE
jgi:hypothetical protein